MDKTVSIRKFLTSGQDNPASAEEMASSVLVTPRLILRRMTEGDYEAVAAILQDEDTMCAYGGAFSDGETRQWLDRQMKRYRLWGFGLWAVVSREGGRMIGQCGLTRQEWNGREVLEIGYLFNRGYWHRGYATEAAEACKRYAFDVLRAGEVCSIIRDSNVPSQRVALRIGMVRKEGVMTKFYRGTVMPHWLYSISNPY